MRPAVPSAPSFTKTFRYVSSFAVVAIVVWLASALSVRADLIINTMPAGGTAGAFGERGPAGGTLSNYAGQTFEALSGLAQDLTFVLKSVSTGSIEGIDFRVLLTETQLFGNEYKPTNVLFESAPLLAPLNQTATFTVNLGGLDLVDGATYAWILDSYVQRDGLPGSGFLLVGQTPYANGRVMSSPGYSSGTRASHFAGAWTQNTCNDDADFAFTLTFSSTPIPEPPAALLGLIGALLLVAVQRTGKPIF